MCFLKLLTVFVVFGGMFSPAVAIDATQINDLKPASQSSQKTVKHAAPANKGQSPKQDMSAHTEKLRALMLALYESHPEELAKSAQISPREMTEWVFDGKFGWRFDSLRRAQDHQALDLLFDERFQGDHVLALVVGLETSLFHGYGAENEFAIPAEQDASRMQGLACTLRDFQKRYHALMIGPKQVPVLQNAASQQLVSSTLDSILQRIPSVPGQPCP
jgi:hypothetical protein